jgi:hypothetical protein
LREALFVPQSNHRIDAHGAARGDVTRSGAGGRDLLNPPLPYEAQALEALKARLSGAGSSKKPLIMDPHPGVLAVVAAGTIIAELKQSPTRISIAVH